MTSAQLNAVARSPSQRSVLYLPTARKRPKDTRSRSSGHDDAEPRQHRAVRRRLDQVRSRKRAASEEVEQFVHADGTARFDLGQGREAPAREASDRPAVRRDAQVSAAFLSRRRSTRMLRRVLIASAAAAMLLVTPSPMTHSPAAAAACAPEVSTAAACVAAGGYRGGAVAGRGYRGGAVAVRGGHYGYRGLRGLSRLRCRCGGSGRGGGRRSCDGGLLPRRLRLQRLRQLGLPGTMRTERRDAPWLEMFDNDGEVIGMTACAPTGSYG